MSRQNGSRQKKPAASTIVRESQVQPQLRIWGVPSLEKKPDVINKFQPAINCMFISSLGYRNEHTFNGMVESEGTRVPYIPTLLQLYNLHTQSLSHLPTTCKLST